MADDSVKAPEKNESTDAANKAAGSENSEHDALIVRMAQENLLKEPNAENKALLTFDLAPDNKLTRYGLVTLDGLGKMPEGMWNSAKHNLSHPLEMAQTFGMGAGVAFALKTLLPEAGISGKLVGAGIGLYFTYKCMEPVIDGYSKAGSARTMQELDLASTQIGNASGAFVVDSVIAMGGYKLGSHYTGKMLSSRAFDGFADAKAGFYEKLANGTRKITDTARITTPKPADVVPVPQHLTGGIEPRVKFLASERTTPQGFLKGEVDANANMEVSVMLKSKGSQLRMNRTIARITEGRQAPLTDVEIRDIFGPTKASLEAVTKFAKDHGLQITETNLTAGRVVLKGNTGQFAEAFDTRLAKYEAFTGETFNGREGSISVPANLANHIVGVLGMDNRPQARSYIQFAGPVETPAGKSSGPPVEVPGKTTAPVEVPGKTTGPVDAPAKPPESPPSRPADGPIAEPNARRGYLPNEVADAYNFPKESMGEGQAVGIIQLGGGFDRIDNAKYYKKYGLPEPEVKIIETGGGKNSPGHPADAEVMLDSQVIGAVAPKATQHVIFAPNSEKGFVDAILRATFPEAGEKPNSAISISWGMNEEGWSRQAIDGMNQAFKKALLKGISIFAASGDDGARNNSSSGKLLTDYPASDPIVTGSGGTRMVTGPDGKIQSEVVWNNKRPNDAGGGGISEVFGPQEFQKDVNVPVHANTGKPGRGVPDVAGNADPVTGYKIRVNGSETLTGGTSAVSPLYAALMMRINGALGKPFATPLNPWLYKNANKGFFNDVVSGDNGGYNAGKGWDATTGLGSIDGTKMLDAMRMKPHVKPGPGGYGEFRFVGPTDLNLQRQLEAKK